MEPAYLHLRPEQAPPEMSSRPFRAVIVADVTVEETWRSRITEWLVARGCLYAIAWGIDCEVWHDSVDWAVLNTFDFGDIPDDRFVMTTWHAEEPLSEAFWFAGNCASHPNVELEETIILHISREARPLDMVRTYRESQEVGDGVADDQRIS